MKRNVRKGGSILSYLIHFFRGGICFEQLHNVLNDEIRDVVIRHYVPNTVAANNTKTWLYQTQQRKETKSLQIDQTIKQRQKSLIKSDKENR